MKSDTKIYIAGHKGLAGSAIERKLRSLGYTQIIGRSSKELDLRTAALISVGVGDVIRLVDRVVKTHVGVLHAEHGPAELGAIVPAGRIETGTDLERISFVQRVAEERIEIQRQRVASKSGHKRRNAEHRHVVVEVDHRLGVSVAQY